jgi:multisubunit Na+/H+ antiporter MnhG subunit
VRIARRHGLLILWAIFAAIIVHSGSRPDGYFLINSTPDQWTYPSLGVASILALTVLELAAMLGILRPTSYSRSWKRALSASLFSLFLALGFGMLLMHMPHYIVWHVGWLIVLFILSNILLCVSGTSAFRARGRRGTNAA